MPIVCRCAHDAICDFSYNLTNGTQPEYLREARMAGLDEETLELILSTVHSLK